MGTLWEPQINQFFQLSRRVLTLSKKKFAWFSGLLLWNYQRMNVKFQEGVGRHDKFRKTIVKFPSARVYVYVVVRKVGHIHVVSQYYYYSKIWKEVSVSVSYTFKHQEGCGFFFSTHFCCQRYFCKITWPFKSQFSEVL